MLTINKTAEILKQINYRKSNRFFNLASQRLMVFIDDSKTEGAKALYEETAMPDEWKINWGDKREFIFTRLDIYFYDNENCINPPKITEKVVFYVDKLVPYESKTDCVEKRYVFSNELFDYCNLQVIDPKEESKIKAYFGNTNNVPNVESDITKPNQIYYFVQDNEYLGHHRNYNSLNFCMFIHMI